MRGDESASTLTTPPLPIKTMFLASVTPTGPHSPQHLLTTAIHTHTQQQVQTSTPRLHAIFQTSTVPNPTSDHVLAPYVVEGYRVGGEKSHLYALHLREACVCHPPYRRNLRGRQTGALCASLRLRGGGHGRLRGCKRL